MNDLDSYLTTRGILSQDFASEVGASVSTISRLRRGLQVPSMPLVEKIVERTKGVVSADSFLSIENRARVVAAGIAIEASQSEVTLNG